MLKKIVSGGQTGVDIAAWRAAKAMGLDTYGYMPRGFRTLNAERPYRPEYAQEYGAQETKSPEWTERTQRNVAAADGTLYICTYDGFNSRGMQATKKAADAYQLPFFFVPVAIVRGELVPYAEMPFSPSPEEFAAKLIGLGWESINIAGNRDAALEEPVEAWLRLVFAEVMRRQAQTGGEQ